MENDTTLRLTVRLLLDENFPKQAFEILLLKNHDVIWVRTHSPGITDGEVLALAVRERRVVLTLDKDFLQPSGRGFEPGSLGIILFRVHPAIPDKIVPVVLQTLALPQEWFGYLTIVSEDNLHMVALATSD